MSVDFVKFLLRGNHLVRRLSSVGTASQNLVAETTNRKNVMQAWQIQRYGNINELKLSDVASPSVKKSSEVLIKVLASSVNPIDVAMLGGYGNVLLDTMRKVDPVCNKDVTLPLILGRDFAGEVLAKGASVRPDIMIGDIVYGVIPPHCQGCHSQLTVVDQSLIVRKPDNIGTVEASSVLYAGLTAWSALKITGDLILASPQNKKVLVIGAMGGVGHMAVQLLKAWGIEAAATCRTDCIDPLADLGVRQIVDYTHRDHMQLLNQIGKFDIILDASGNASPVTYVPLLKEWANSKFISLRSPLLQNTDSYGLLAGMARNAADLVVSNMSSGAPAKGSTIRWGFFMPVPAGIKEIAKLIAEGKASPRCKPPASAPKKLEKIINQCQDEIKYTLLQEALDILGETVGHKRSKRETFSGEEKRIAGCLLQCVYKKMKALDKNGIPTGPGLVSIYSEGVQDRNYYLATVQGVQRCLAKEIKARSLNPLIAKNEGYACDVAYDMFECVSDQIELICGHSP